ncbi:MAG: hypothetical protein ABW185_29400 [Sedimenticola sp.]
MNRSHTSETNSMRQQSQQQQSNQSEVKQHNPSSDANSVKQRDLRQQEQKLKKWEDELKYREAKSLDLVNQCKRLEDYLAKTEARNVELDKTIRTLQRKISCLENDKKTEPNEHNDATKHEITNQNSTTTTDELIIGVREKVTQYILRKVSQQIDNLEISEATNSTQPQNIKPNIGLEPISRSNTGVHLPADTRHMSTVDSIGEVNAATGQKEPVITPRIEIPERRDDQTDCSDSFRYRATVDGRQRYPNSMVRNPERNQYTSGTPQYRHLHTGNTNNAQTDNVYSYAGQPIYYADRIDNAMAHREQSFLRRASHYRRRR